MANCAVCHARIHEVLASRLPRFAQRCGWLLGDRRREIVVLGIVSIAVGSKGLDGRLLLASVGVDGLLSAKHARLVDLDRNDVRIGCVVPVVVTRIRNGDDKTRTVRDRYRDTRVEIRADVG